MEGLIHGELIRGVENCSIRKDPNFPVVLAEEYSCIRFFPSFTICFTLIVSRFSLKVQVKALRYVVRINSMVQLFAKRMLEI